MHNQGTWFHSIFFLFYSIRSNFNLNRVKTMPLLEPVFSQFHLKPCESGYTRVFDVVRLTEGGTTAMSRPTMRPGRSRSAAFNYLLGKFICRSNTNRLYLSNGCSGRCSIWKRSSDLFHSVHSYSWGFWSGCSKSSNRKRPALYDIVLKCCPSLGSYQNQDYQTV